MLEQVCSDARESLSDYASHRRLAVRNAIIELEKREKDMVSFLETCINLTQATEEVRKNIAAELTPTSDKKRDIASVDLDDFDRQASVAVQACKKLKEEYIKD